MLGTGLCAIAAIFRSRRLVKLFICGVTVVVLGLYFTNPKNILSAKAQDPKHNRAFRLSSHQLVEIETPDGVFLCGNIKPKINKWVAGRLMGPTKPASDGSDLVVSRFVPIGFDIRTLIQKRSRATGKKLLQIKKKLRNLWQQKKEGKLACKFSVPPVVVVEPTLTPVPPYCDEIEMPVTEIT